MRQRWGVDRANHAPYAHPAVGGRTGCSPCVSSSFEFIIMRAFVASDHSPTAHQLHELLVQLGHDCPLSRLVPLELAMATLGFASDVHRIVGDLGAACVSNQTPELVLVVLGPDCERAINVLRNIRSASQSHILAVGPTSDSKLILRTLRDGANEYLDESDLRTELPAALERLRSSGQVGRIVVVLGPNGGTGASTVAANLAVAVAASSGRCALIDMKIETGDLAALLDLKPTHTIAELCRNAERMDWTIVESSLVRHSCGVHLLAAPESLADAQHVGADSVSRALSIIREHFPIVVTDLDRAHRPEQSVVLLQSDIVLIVLRLDFTSLRNTRRVLREIQLLGIGTERLRLVINRYGQPNELPASKAEEALGMKITYMIPEDAKAINRANNNGTPVVLDAPSSKVARSLITLAASINGTAKPK